jgi:hypothetical protein
MLEHMSQTEFYNWMVLEKMQPFGEVGHDFRMATIAALLANIHRDPKTHSEAFTIQDFMPKIAEPKEPQTADQQMAIMRMFQIASEPRG